MKTSCLFLVLAATGSLSALDVDLRLGWGLRSNSTDFSSGGVSSTENWDSSNRISGGAVVQAMPALTGAWLVGARVVMDLSSIDDATLGNSDYTNTAIHIQGGYGFLVTPLVRLEILPYLGLGYAKLDTDNAGSGSASSLEFGIDLNGAVTLPGGLQLGAGIGYAATSASPSIDSGTVDIDQSGVVGSIFIGYRL
jgi:hypothetical protein